MYVKVSRWGNSLAVRLPRMAIETLRIKDDDSVNIMTQGDAIIIRPVKLTLEKLFEGYSGEEYDFYDWGEFDAPAGRELI